MYMLRVLGKHIHQNDRTILTNFRLVVIFGEREREREETNI